MFNIISIYFLLFISYAILGWCMEVVVKFIEYKRFINRGFLIGPYCPIYGMGAVLVTSMLGNFTNKPILLFLLSVIIAATLEYITSWAMEKIFKARWWDYSTDKFNINGRISLATMIPFGILSMAIMYISNPIFIRMFGLLNEKQLICTMSIVAFVFTADLLVSTTILLAFKNDNKLLERDNTEEMSKKVRKIIANRGWGQRRLVIAFPNLKHVGTKIKENAKEITESAKQKIGSAKEKIEENAKEMTESAKQKIGSAKEKIGENAKEITENAKQKIGEYSKKIETFKGKHK